MKAVRSYQVRQIKSHYDDADFTFNHLGIRGKAFSDGAGLMVEPCPEVLCPASGGSKHCKGTTRLIVPVYTLNTRFIQTQSKTFSSEGGGYLDITECNSVPDRA